MPRAFSSCAGSTRASIKKRLFKKMDCRVKPGNDDYCRPLMPTANAQLNATSWPDLTGTSTSLWQQRKT
jgi:hypothetical protein